MDLSYVRNFVIISHIDHGKSTLADRFLELTKTISREKMHSCYLDSMDLEKEKGITIKMHPCRLYYSLQTTHYMLNLIDTPGHIDFSYETSRALAAVEGAILLVDATKGIQAQTLANLELAKKQGLVIIPAVNKIDLLQARVEETKEEVANLLNIPKNEIFEISAKCGTNVEKLLQAVIEKVPCPKGEVHKPLRALIFDSKYDPFKGVIAYLRVVDGEIRTGEKIYLMATETESEIKEVGYFFPQLKSCSSLKAGEIGYIKTGIKESSKVKVGDTITKISNIKYQISNLKQLPGYKEPQSVLFLSLYPKNSDEFENLKESLSKLKLNDPTLNFEMESKMDLGRGFRCGFLGSLHAEIIARRLKQEFDLDLILTSPQVIFKILTKKGEEIFASSPALLPDPSQIQEIQEPWIELEVITPNSYFNSVFKILENFSASIEKIESFTSQKSILSAQTSLREIISGNFYDKLKSTSQGYASFSFRQIGFKKSDLVKLDILINGEPEEPFSKIVPREKAFSEGKKIVCRLKELLPPQQFTVSLQAVLGGRVIARETISARRKDVTAPLYGGDVTRKRKLLEIQKRGKKELKAKGKINIPSRVFLEILKED
jgi:GTP-binding protein LepA